MFLIFMIENVFEMFSQRKSRWMPYHQPFFSTWKSRLSYEGAWVKLRNYNRSGGDSGVLVNF